jgi:hypothetical protein
MVSLGNRVHIFARQGFIDELIWCFRTVEDALCNWRKYPEIGV